MHILTGLPRAGSTLLCNILNQNPKFKATSTSTLCKLLTSVSNLASTSFEYKAELDRDKNGATERLVRTLKAMVENWHNTDKVIFDKSREWSHHILMLRQLYPDCKVICMVRDLRNVFASIEKQHRKSPVFDSAVNATQKTIETRGDTMFAKDGLIGHPLEGINDLRQRNHNGVLFVQYETLVKNPQLVMDKIYELIGEEPFKHDFDNVKNTAEEPDGFYLHKFPHKGEGKVVEQDKREWEKFVSQDIADGIMNNFSPYNQYFGYEEVNK